MIEDLDALHTWRELARRLRAANEDLEPALRSIGVGSTAGFEVLELLTRVPQGELPQRQVQEAVGLSQSGISRLVTRLENAGLLRRAASKTDARAALLRITETGRDLVGTHRDGYEARVREELKALSAELRPGRPESGNDASGHSGAPADRDHREPDDIDHGSPGGLLQFGES
ncbi:MAG TPA: MarR family transcriptional regulator, partial [Streptomyces sp.]|nr:MarR family transcriptional regulator [Streptomyces sp.]